MPERLKSIISKSKNPLELQEAKPLPIVQKVVVPSQINEVAMCNTDCMDCKNELNLHKVCAKKAKVKCLCVNTAIAKEVCSDQIDAVMLHAESENVNDLCAQNIKAKTLGALSLSANSLCAQSAVMDNLCVNNLQVKNWMNCNRYRATAVLSAPMIYALGDPINFDVVLDDPNGNVAVGPFSYTVPKSGYYNLSLHVDAAGLSGANVITGTPSALLEVKVNGLEFRDLLSPWLSFSLSQTSLLSSLVMLNAGDVVTCDYKLQVISPVGGLEDYVGNVILAGNGTFASNCSFGIILTSELCVNQPVQCTICPPVEVPCEPVSVMCSEMPCPQPRPEPVRAELDEDCDSCQ